MTVREIFEKAESGTLTYEQFEAAMSAAKAKFVDLNEGNYVSKNKYDADIQAKTDEISTLNDTIKTRDTDLANLQTQLEAAGTDATKLNQLSTDLQTLQGKYDADVKAYKAQLSKQAYEFAVREFANTKKFTSQAAKRDFTQALIAKELKLENNQILGAEDFVQAYTKDNADAFAKEKDPEQKTSFPQFVNPTSGGDNNPSPEGGFKFNFVGVRPHDAK